MNKKLIIIIVAVVLLLAIIGGAVWFFVLRGDGEPKDEPVVYLEFPLGEQYSNIKDAEGATKKKVLKFSAVIEYTDAELEPIFTEKKTRILNEMKKYFMTKKEEQLKRLERVQEDLTDIVIEVLDTAATPDTVTDVLFVEYIIP